MSMLAEEKRNQGTEVTGAMSAGSAGTGITAERPETGVRSLAEYEARIRIYKEQIGTGFIGIGRTLAEAKAAGVVPHGEWEDWVTRTTGLTLRQAQRCMQAAREIRDGSALAQLEMSKALLLLSSGLEEKEQEQIAQQAREDGSTLREMQEQVKKLKLQLVRETGVSSEMRQSLRKVQAERDSVVSQIQDTKEAFQHQLRAESRKAYNLGRMDGAEEAGKKAREEADQAYAQEMEESRQAILGLHREIDAQRQYAEELRASLLQAENNRVEVVPEDYEKLKRNQADLLAAAEEAEQRAARAEAQLEDLRTGMDCGRSEEAWKILYTAVTRFMADCEMLPLQDPGSLRIGETRIRSSLDYLQSWMDSMRQALSQDQLTGEGAVR